MKQITHIAALLVVLLVAVGCAGFNTGGQFVAGRQALLIGDPESALGYFVGTAQSNPNYVFIGSNFKQGIWTYVGRAQYLTKRYPEARASLERAVDMDRNDFMGHLFLGMTLARTGDLSRGVKEIESGMKGIFDFLEYMERTQPMQAFWDPLREMRATIDKDLQSIGSKDFNPENLIADGEWLGKRMEEEIDNVRRDERRLYERDFDRGRSGGSVGFGIGF
jgi:tetratricopeptide (TPR) repeat protein